MHSSFNLGVSRISNDLSQKVEHLLFIEITFVNNLESFYNHFVVVIFKFEGFHVHILKNQLSDLIWRIILYQVK